ncbi:MAG: bifunctional UDP-N-acetylglucosamine diphosphorylase/glucosamine-1-phosphate N-acetyltransferase GlmU [Gammaproteobacteria bacterium]|nr:bifunctional UDP-N-acetylglucosamine diphosphorylase/glucosamine-1-phosphate N-acetyltransferase GlmU [Gammaproteobacteria bacterium]
MALNIIILAAGKGTRMRSSTAKVLHKVAGQSLIEHVINSAYALRPDHVLVVHGSESNQIKKQCSNYPVDWVLQTEQGGTGHAVQQALPYINAADDSHVLILYADVPLLQIDTLEALRLQLNSADLALLSMHLDEPKGYGRIVRSSDNAVEGIVEEGDANEIIKQIKEVNSGIMAARLATLRECLRLINNDNAQSEYYLTDCVAAAKQLNKTVIAQSCQADEAQGVNSRAQLAAAELIYQQRRRLSLLDSGVSMTDPATVYIEGQVYIEADVSIGPCVELIGPLTIATGTRISSHSVISNSAIAKNTSIHSFCHIEDAKIGEGCELGPYARIRPQTKLSAGVKIGNFVETKKSEIGKGSKVNHLSYIGDAKIGEQTNVGAGTICCNYDGANKHQTIIGDNVFIGSDTQLVAPVEIEDGATVAAGSTITKKVPTQSLALSRAKQTIISNWQRPKKRS